MKHALFALALSGCVTTTAILKKPDVGLPLLVGAAVADVIVVSIAASQVQDFTVGAAIATGVAFTTVDVAVTCLTVGCRPLLKL